MIDGSKALQLQRLDRTPVIQTFSEPRSVDERHTAFGYLLVFQDVDAVYIGRSRQTSKRADQFMTPVFRDPTPTAL